MKIFETPEMEISVFESENVVTASGGAGQQDTAVQQALAAAQDGTTISGSAGTLMVDLW